MGAEHAVSGGEALARAVERSYQAGQTDYYLKPLLLTNTQDQPLGQIRDGDSVVFCCRRGEREIQLTEAFTDPAFRHFPLAGFQDLTFVILTQYHEKFQHLAIAYPPSQVTETVGELISQAGLRQLRVAESEKFAHVTHFFNGGRAEPFPGEDDICIPSPKGIPFDQVPGLSLSGVCAAVIQGIRDQYDFILTNFANGDVIGHTDSRQAKLDCARIVDRHLGQVISAARDDGYLIMITADHGNLEVMQHPDGSPHVSHTSNPVPLIMIDPLDLVPARELKPGILADIGPTLLSALGVDTSSSMHGSVLGQVGGIPRRVLLVILDGWGIGENNAANPIYLAETPVYDDLLRSYSNCQLQAAGEQVGLKAGKAGNSEAGHLNIGAGRIVLQDDARLDLALRDGSFYSNPAFQRAVQKVAGNGGSLHLIALLSEKSSHGSVDYPLALLETARQQGLDRVWIHLIFDGRSTEPGSAPELLRKFQSRLDMIGIGQIASGVGRGLALDRDGNYAKTQLAYDSLVFSRGERVKVE